MNIASAVEKPFNDFIDTAEKLVKDEAEFDLKTDEEVANYLLNNIYIGEQTIGQLDPNAKRQADERRNDARKEIERWSLDDLKIRLPKRVMTSIM